MLHHEFSLKRYLRRYLIVLLATVLYTLPAMATEGGPTDPPGKGKAVAALIPPGNGGAAAGAVVGGESKGEQPSEPRADGPAPTFTFNELLPTPTPLTTPAGFTADLGAPPTFSFDDLAPAAPQSGYTDTLKEQQKDLIRYNARLKNLNDARAAIAKAIDAGKFIQKLDSLAFMEFPVAISDTIGSVPVHLVFNHLRLYPEYAELSVVVGMELPQRKVTAMDGEPQPDPGNDDEGNPYPPISEYVELFFGSPAIRFGHDGGLIGDATLGLYADVPIGTQDPDKFAFILNKFYQTPDGSGGMQSNGTFVTIDCDGFKEMGVAGEVLFSREWIVPTNAQGNVLNSGRVKGSVSLIVADWNNILATVSLPNFALSSNEDLAFSLNNAVFDFSDLRNSPSVKFPDGYAASYLPPGNPNVWRGVYIQSLTVTLPPQFNKSCNGTSSTEPRPGGLLLDEERDYVLDDTGRELPAVALGRGDAPLAWDPPPPDLANGRGPAPPPEGGHLSFGGGLNGWEDATSPLAPSTTSSAPAVAPDYLLNAAPDTENFELYVPDFRETAANNCRVTVGVEDLLIDHHGVSGKFFAQNVLSLGEGGKMDKWGFSVQSVELELLTNDVVGFGFGGQIRVPVAKESETLTYDAFVNIQPNSWNYNVNVVADGDMTWPVFKMGEVQLDSASYITVTGTATEFLPSATLHGHAAIKAKLNSSSPDGDDSNSQPSETVLHAAKLSFRGIKLQTVAPAFDMETNGFVRFDHDPKLLGFPLPISQPELRKVGTDSLRFSVTVQLNLMNQSDNGFAAGTSLSIDGALEDYNGKQRWTFSNFRVNDIYANLVLPALEIRGYAAVFDGDPTFGKGFQGSLSVRVGPDPNSPVVSIAMNAMFGKVGGYRYWYVDGLLESSAIGVPIVPGVLELNGFGGGAYYHMRMDGVSPPPQPGQQTLGMTSSGVSYVPDNTVYLGLKAMVTLTSAGGTETLDGVATLELVFGGQGLQEFMFYGKVEIQSPSVNRAFGGFSNQLRSRLTTIGAPKSNQETADELQVNTPQNSITGTVFIRVNLQNGFLFQGTFRAWLDAANGKVKGVAGIDLLVDHNVNIGGRTKWHLYIGGYTDNSITASDGQTLPPITVQLNLGSGIQAGLQAYFLVGNDIPGPPPTPPAVRAKFGSGQPNNRAGSMGRMAAGTGFAFGAHAYAYFDKWFYAWPVWVHVWGSLHLGFDVSLLRYDPTTRCSRSGHYNHGTKDWRATGRLYAILDVNVKVGAIRGGIGVGLDVQADVPNPNWFKLKGWVKFCGDHYFETEVGDRCGQVVY